MSPGNHLVRLQDAERILSESASRDLVERIRRFATGGGDTTVSISSLWRGALRWALNDTIASSDQRDLSISITRSLPNRTPGNVTTNQVDDESLGAAVRAAERLSRAGSAVVIDYTVPLPKYHYLNPAIWSDATFDLHAAARAATARGIATPSTLKNVLSAGYLSTKARTLLVHPAASDPYYAAWTHAQCTVTVRDQTGAGSGWAGLSSFDWSTIDAEALGKRALEKCIASRNPVALEPGRYTVILEPQAVYDLVSQLLSGTNFDLQNAENQHGGPFFDHMDNALQLGDSKLGLNVVDERISIMQDPMDPALGVVPFVINWPPDPEPIRPVTWIDHGVLMHLPAGRNYMLPTRLDSLGNPNGGDFRMTGGTTTMDQMIATTERGLIVTRFSNVIQLLARSVLLTGLTRDGLWLVEHGKITKAVKNFRFTESPLFVLNSIEQLGVPTRVYTAGAPAIVPPIKARDFSFTSLIDAI